MERRRPDPLRHVSTDDGATWRRAALRDPRGRDPGVGPASGHGWSRFSFVWRRPAAGSRTLIARATDAAGRTQPLTSPFNIEGYFFDAVVRHPVTVV